MPEASESELRQRAQDGKNAVMDAIVGFLKVHADHRFDRSEIERPTRTRVRV